jgi:hypothetical protein
MVPTPGRERIHELGPSVYRPGCKTQNDSIASRREVIDCDARAEQCRKLGHQLLQANTARRAEQSRGMLTRAIVDTLTNQLLS